MRWGKAGCAAVEEENLCGYPHLSRAATDGFFDLVFSPSLRDVRL